MSGVRRVAWSTTRKAPCSWCNAPGSYWDRLAGKSCCPDCQEGLASGEAPPLVASTERRRCAVCQKLNTVPFITFPLHTSGALALDLCPGHFRALLGRCLSPAAFQQIRRRLNTVGLSAAQVFLLHEVFYDSHGRALQPVLLLDD